MNDSRNALKNVRLASPGQLASLPCLSPIDILYVLDYLFHIECQYERADLGPARKATTTEPQKTKAQTFLKRLTYAHYRHIIVATQNALSRELPKA